MGTLPEQTLKEIKLSKWIKPNNDFSHWGADQGREGRENDGMPRSRREEEQLAIRNNQHIISIKRLYFTTLHMTTFQSFWVLRFSLATANKT